jgi:hypothetical protein
MHIPDSLSEIERKAFANCGNLKISRRPGYPQIPCGGKRPHLPGMTSGDLKSSVIVPGKKSSF